MPKILPILLALLIMALIAGALWINQDDEPIASSLALSEAMGGDTTGYARAEIIRPFTFPADHGAHPDFKTEWWYFTGNLDTGNHDAADGRHFGYQFTLFRIALTPPDTSRIRRASAWATNQIYMAHFTLTDVEAGQFHAFERFSRGAEGLAGAEAAPFYIWLEDWTVAGTGNDPFPMRLQAKQDGIGLDITLDPVKPLVLQGNEGLDQKGPESGNASYYYSATRLATTGTVTVGETDSGVDGLSWMDREWSTSALSDDEVGWDWFALQLSDGRDLMYYQLRRRNGRPSAESDGVLVATDGSKQQLHLNEVQLDVLDTWQSSLDDAEYPARWRLRIPAESLDLEITPYLADQELDVAVRYWEGTVRVEGTANGKVVTGTGYVELTGYNEGSTGKTPGG